MFEIASQMILCLLLAALIGAIIGYILGKSTCDDDNCGEDITTHDSESIQENTHQGHETRASATTVAASSVMASEAASASEDNIPLILSGPRNGEKDNLTRIKGVGMKIEEMLNNVGIYHFDQISEWTEGNIEWADSTLGFPGRANREAWVTQAQALAAGGETEFSKRVDNGEVSSSKQS